MTHLPQAVFLSYASQDAEAAKRIAEALRAAGVEVWFDQNELVGGDAWDAKIRKQIAECALFVPVISANTQARLEGYFRIEWKIAARRTHAMAAAKAFLLPVVIDTTPDAGAHVPDEFREVQWTRLPHGEASEKFCGRVLSLLRGAAPADASAAHSSPARANPAKPARANWRLPAIAVAMLILATLGLWLWQVSLPGTISPARTAAEVAVTPTAAGSQLAHAWALLEDDPLMTRANVELAEQIGMETLAKEPTNAEANALCAWTNFLYLLENYDDSPQRVADLKKYADKAKLLAPDSIHAELAMCGMLVSARQFDEAFRRLQGLADRAPGNLTVQRTWAWTITWGRGATWSVGQDGEHPAMERLRALSPLGRAYADTFAASRAWARGNYAEADRIVDGVFASGHPVRLTYLNRLLVLTYGWGDLAAAREFVKTIPAKLLLEDVFIYHVSILWFFSGEYDQMLATVERTSRPLLHEARVVTPTSELRGRALDAAGRNAAAAIQWQETLKLLNQRLEREPDNYPLRTSRAMALARLGQMAAARQEVALVGELEKAAPGNLAWGSHYELTNELGDLDDTIARFDRVIAQDNPRWPNAYNHVRYEPTYAKLRADPRGQAILARGEKWLAELRAKSSTAESRSAPASGGAAEKSVAVLAFANLSDEKANEYFSDGISEELLNVLAKVPGLKVTARTSSFHFKGKDVPIPEIAQQLGVAYVVEGSVRKAGDKVRITAQLIKAADGFHVWSDTFTRDLKDVFAVQDEIAGIVARNLSLQLGVSARSTHETNPEAFALLMQGRQFWSLRTREGFARAGELYTRAIMLDPQWSRAYAALASLQVIEASFRSGDGEDMSALFAESERNALRALELEPNLADAYAALGKLATDRRQWTKAAENLERALTLDPNHVAALDWSADLNVLQGRIDLALAGYRHALELDPLSPFVLFDNSWALLHLGRFVEMQPLIKRAVELSPINRVRLSVRQAHMLLRLGLKDEAAAALRPALKGLGAGEDGAQIPEAMWCLQQLGWKAEAEQLATDVLGQTRPSFAQGLLLMTRGRVQEAYPYLALASPIMYQVIFFDPVFDPVRDTPEFRTLLRKLGCEKEYATARETLARMLREKSR